MKKILAFLLLAGSLFFTASASESATSAFVEGCRFYSEGQWASAKMLLKKAVSYPENLTPEVYYMLISAEIYDGDYKGALDDCNVYMDSFPNSLYISNISFQKGLALYNMGEYEKAIIALSDFCHQFENSELYASALFYIGESLFASYQYEEASAIFERIVTEFPEAAKAPAAQYRIESILQRAREEKLLYLLKQTGEEYLAAKEEYERQLRLYNSEAVDSTRQKLTAAQARNESLEKQVNELELEIEALKNNQAESERIIQQLKEAGERDIPEPEPFDEKKYQLKLLKAKALEAQRMLDEKLGTSSTEGK
jgi:TolA-binding protein